MLTGLSGSDQAPMPWIKNLWQKNQFVYFINSPPPTPLPPSSLFSSRGPAQIVLNLILLNFWSAWFSRYKCGTLPLTLPKRLPCTSVQWPYCRASSTFPGYCFLFMCPWHPRRCHSAILLVCYTEGPYCHYVVLSPPTPPTTALVNNRHGQQAIHSNSP